MKIKLNKIYNNLEVENYSIQRIDKNIISLTNLNKNINILLPENFELDFSAVKQLINFSDVKSVNGKETLKTIATPDFHKGKQIPIGSVVVTPHDLVIPQAIGTDINCGMRLYNSGILLDDFLAQKTTLIKLLKGDLLGGTRDIPTNKQSMEALFQYGVFDFFESIEKNKKGIFLDTNYSQIYEEILKLPQYYFGLGDLKYAPQNLINREWMRDPSLATIGSGNHFLEFQFVEEILDRKKAFELNIEKNQVVVMVHTGSRDVGFYVGNCWSDYAKSKYPKNLKHPTSKIYSLENDDVEKYLSAMTVATHYGTLNRILLGEIVKQRIKQVFKKEDSFFIADCAHNICIKEDIGIVHRKGSTPAYQDELVLIPGSMGNNSFLSLGLGNKNWIESASHGAGRQISRNKANFLLKDKGKFNFECVTLKESRKIEEAPEAYKDITPVITSQTEEQVIKNIAKLSPLFTFKA